MSFLIHQNCHFFTLNIILSIICVCIYIYSQAFFFFLVKRENALFAEPFEWDMLDIKLEKQSNFVKYVV